MTFNVIDPEGSLSEPRDWSAKRMHTDIIRGEISLFASDVELQARYGTSFAVDRRRVFSEMAYYNGCVIMLDDTGITDDNEEAVPEIVATCPVRGDLEKSTLKELIRPHLSAYSDTFPGNSCHYAHESQIAQRRITCYRMPLAEYSGQPANFFASTGEMVGSLYIPVKR